MRIGSALVIALCVCLCRLCLAQNPYEFGQYPDPQNYYYIDTYKTDVGPGGELVRPERSFFKKLFKNWGRRWDDDGCVQCCQNNPGYKGGAAGNGDYGNGYGDEEQYDDSYGPPFNPQDLPPGHHGHIYLPLPHPHRVMSHLHSYMNRPFRRGYGGKMGPPGYYSSKGVAPAAVKPYEPPPKEEPADAYQEPAPDEPAPVEPPPVEPEPVEPAAPDYSEKPADSSGEKYDQKEEEVYKEDGDKKYEEAPAPEPAPAPAPAPVTPQVIQPIVPIIAPPVYVYPQQFYPPPPISYGQSYVYPAQSSLGYPATSIQYSAPAVPVQYSAPPPTTVSYSAPAPSIGPSYSLPAPSVQVGPSPVQPQPQAVPTYTPPAPESSYSPPTANPTYTPTSPEPAISPPAPSYSQVDPPQPEPQSHWHLLPTNPPPPSPLSYYPLLPRPELEGSILPSPFSNPSDCGYVEKTYSASLTYLQSPSPPTSYYNPLAAPPSCGNDQLMRSCPELFRDYQLGLQASSVSRPCGY